jgi:hypothetical protein
MFTLTDIFVGIVLFIVFGSLSIVVVNRTNKFTLELWFLLTTAMGGSFVIIVWVLLFLYEYLVGKF